jgi:hypothetical protein
MKYLKITLEGNKSVLVDESTEIRMDDYYMDDRDLVRQAVTSDKDYWLRRPDYYKVIATINHSISLDVPMVIVEDSYLTVSQTMEMFIKP